MFMISKLLALALLSPLAAAVHAAEGDSEWISLFNGKDLTGWKPSENPETFTVANGAIVAHGKRSHLFYTGSVNEGVFKNFELQVDVMTHPNSNGGIYFHTEFQGEGWPEKGFEVQVNNTCNDKRRTGSLYGVEDVFEAPAKDNEWFTQHIIVQGNKVTIKVHGKTVVEWTQPAGFQGLNEKKEGVPYFPLRKLDSGTFALQGHDPGGVVYYTNIRVKPLP
jgi:hypothetical protein